ncbi:methyl-accepting chemotaxis protein [Paenibacillus sp. CAA11]|uniref:methyl-accepting chemotaxis protein n=1 Tax=Paenibacillus sp. CAA11 TaxID=1532905 RepID=UPI00131F18B7|nr:methyl-accepting chemotaxis protein [Paenibacillus sp. CAA11]
MNIRNKLYCGFISVLLITFILGAISLVELRRVDRTYSDLIDERVAKIMLLDDIKFISASQAENLRGYLITGSEEGLQEFKSDQELFTADLNKLAGLVSSSQVKGIIEELNQMEAKYKDVGSRLISLREKNDLAGIAELVEKECIPLAAQMTNKAEELSQQQQKLLNQANEDTTEQVMGIQSLIFYLIVICIIVGLVIAYVISRMISRPVASIAAKAKQIAQGDLTGEDLAIKNKDETGVMAASFNDMKHNLRELIARINDSSEQVAASSEELYAGAEQATAAANQVATAVQEVAGDADRQMSSTQENKKALITGAESIQYIAESAAHVMEMSESALQNADQGAKLIDQTIEQMKKVRRSVQSSSIVVNTLGEHSKQISGIVDIIHDIAGQTNLLALNASIEAARAGEQGRGFGVVAGEVKKLAEQAKEASEQIAELIQGILEQVEGAVTSMEAGAEEVAGGTDLVNQAGTAFYDILSGLQHVTGQAQKVAEATEHISAATQQSLANEEMMASLAAKISDNSQGVAAASQEQLASMEEVSASADYLSKLAQELRGEIQRFQV